MKGFTGRGMLGSLMAFIASWGKGKAHEPLHLNRESPPVIEGGNPYQHSTKYRNTKRYGAKGWWAKRKARNEMAHQSRKINRHT